MRVELDVALQRDAPVAQITFRSGEIRQPGALIDVRGAAFSDDVRTQWRLPCSPPTEDAKNPLKTAGCGRLRLLPDERCPLCSPSLPLRIAINIQRGAHILDQALVLVTAAHLEMLRDITPTSCLRQQTALS